MIRKLQVKPLMGDQMMKAQLRAGWKNSGSIENNSSGLPSSGPKGRKVAQGYKTQGLEGMDSSGLLGSGPKKRRITQGYEVKRVDSPGL